MLARKWSSNSLTSYKKEEIERGFRRSYHSWVDPFSVVGNIWHIRLFEVLNKDIRARNVIVCFVGSESPSKVSKSGRRKSSEELLPACPCLAWGLALYLSARQVDGCLSSAPLSRMVEAFNEGGLLACAPRGVAWVGLSGWLLRSDPLALLGQAEHGPSIGRTDGKASEVGPCRWSLMRRCGFC
ncbi:hypothetical protein B296_00023964 [Ensete ventricosum]|uniref:Uncharacterized protein n=1 Tax=Ensete ventricosum TaxID=4639 RepID=A0A426ZCI8_ENSVE|nr:hypothetical protein B296_00023964 [Ensete ventricosum]